MSTSNRVGHPVRNRKRNRLIYNEDEETSFGPNTKLAAISSAVSPSIGASSGGGNPAGKQSKSANNANASTRHATHPESVLVIFKTKTNKNQLNTLANRIKSMVKLPKSHNWINYEWFYSSIDQVLFLDQNEFNACLDDSFPQLKTRYLARAEWRQIRRLIGKPRRCSKAFFEEERSTLNVRRNKIRFLQQNKVNDLSSYKDLPAMIPQQLVVGTIVCILARQHDHFYYGVIEGIDPSNNTYRINFHSEKPSITVPDYDVVPVNKTMLVPLSSFQSKTRKQSEKVTYRISNDVNNDTTIGGFPVTFLTLLARASNILNVKKNLVDKLKSYNLEVERIASLAQEIPAHFRRQYAMTVLELDNLNNELENYLKKIQSYTLQVGPTDAKAKSLKPSIAVGQMYKLEATSILEKLQSKFKISDKNYSLILNLMNLMCHLRGFKDSDIGSYEFLSLMDTARDARQKLQGRNVELYQNHVDIHLRHIMSCVSRLGNVGVFSQPAARIESAGAND